MTTLYLKQYGNVFEVRLSTDQFSNAWQGRLVLPDDLVVKNLTYGETIGDIWQTPPTFSEGGITFVGGKTMGWSGDGLLFRFTAAPKSESDPPREELIRFDASMTSVYAADGKGTNLRAQLRPITINTEDLLTATTTLPALPGDVPPEPFTITTIQDPSVFGGKLAIIFSTTDAGVGIDHYEVKEYTRDGAIGWHPAQSPYLVDPETTRILVRAIDRNGNFRTEEIMLQQGFPVAATAVFVGALILASLVAGYLIRRWRRKRLR